MPDKIKEVFELISDKGYFTDENEFRSYVSDPKRRAEAFELIKDDGFFTDENEFNSYFGDVKKKELFSTTPPTSFSQQGVGAGVKKPSQSESTSISTTTITPKQVKFQNVDIRKPELEKDKYDKVQERNRIQNYSQGLQKVQVDVVKKMKQREDVRGSIEELQAELEASKGNPEQYNALIPKYNELVDNAKALTNEISSDFNKIDIFEKGIGVTELKRQINEDTVGNRALEGVNNAKRIVLEALPATAQFASYLTMRSRGIDPKTAEKVSTDIVKSGFSSLKKWSRELAEENEDLASVFDRTTAWDVLSEKDKSALDKDWAKVGDLAAKELAQFLPTTLAIMASYINPVVGTTVTIMGTAGMELEEMQGSDMTPDAKIANALTKGGLEWVTEKVFGSIPMLKRAIGMKSKAGQEAYQNIISETWKKFAAKMGFAADVTEEILSEMMNTVGGNYADYISGKTTEADLYKGLGQTFTTSLTMASTLSGAGRAVKYGSKKINELREATKKLKEIAESQETTPEVLQVIEEKIIENNEKIAVEASKEKETFDSMDDETWEEATALIQERQSLEDQLENNEVPADVVPLVEDKIAEKTKQIDALTEEAKVAALERLKVKEETKEEVDERTDSQSDIVEGDSGVSAEKPIEQEGEGQDKIEAKSSEPSKSDKNYEEAQEINSIVSKENPSASVLIQPKGNDLSLTAIYVGKENRGGGIGTKVLESVKAQAKKAGKKVVLDATNELDQETDLGRLGKFYERNGFKKIEETTYEYDPKNEVSSRDTSARTDNTRAEDGDTSSSTDKGESGKGINKVEAKEGVDREQASEIGLEDKILNLLSKSDKKGVERIKRRAEASGMPLIDAAKEYLQNLQSLSGKGKNRFEELSILVKEQAATTENTEKEPTKEQTESVKKNPLRDRIINMEGSAEDKLIALNEYESKYNLSEGAKKNVDKIRDELVSIRDVERKNNAIKEQNEKDNQKEANREVVLGRLGEEGGEDAIGQEGQQLREEEVGEDFNFEKLFEEPTEAEKQKSEAERLEVIDQENEKRYQESGFDKKWAKTYKEAKQKLVEQYNKAKEAKAKAEAKTIKSAGGKSVFVGSEMEGSAVSVNYINRKRRENAINNAQSEMDGAKKDLARLGLTNTEIENLIGIEEQLVELPKEKEQVKKQVSKIVEKKASGKTIGEWKKEAIDLIDKALNTIFDNATNDADVRKKFADGTLDISHAINDNTPQALQEAGFKLSEKGSLIIPTPQGSLTISPSSLPSIRKEVAKLSDSREVSNENTKLPSKPRKVDSQVAAVEFYYPETIEEAKEEFETSKIVLENAKKSGNKKMIELAQVQLDFYKDQFENWDSNQKFYAEQAAARERSEAAIARKKDIEAKSKELNKLINSEFSLFREAGIHEADGLYDLLQALGIKEVPSKMTNELYANLFAKAAIDKGKHTFLTYLTSLSNGILDVPKLTARSSYKQYSKVRQIEETNKSIRALMDLGSKYESEATKVFKDLTQSDTKEGKAQNAIRFLERLKIRANGRALGVLPPLAIPLGIWNAAIDTIVIGIKAGGKISELISEAIQNIKDQKVEFDEKAFRDTVLEAFDVTPAQETTQEEATQEEPAQAETKEETKEEPKAEPKQEEPAQEEPKKERARGGETSQKLSKMFETLESNKSLESLVKDLVKDDFMYDEVGMKADRRVALDYIEKNGLENSILDFFSNKDLGLERSQQVFLGKLLNQAMFRAKKMALEAGDIENANRIHDEMMPLLLKSQRMGTANGRAVNAQKDWALDFSDPITAVFALNKFVEAQNEKAKNSAAAKMASNRDAKDIAKTVAKGKKATAKKVAKDMDEELYGAITKGVKKDSSSQVRKKVSDFFDSLLADENTPAMGVIVPITPKMYNTFIKGVKALVLSGVDMGIAISRVSAQMIREKEGSPKELAEAAKRLREQASNVKEKKEPTELQKARKAAREELDAAAKEFNTEKELAKYKEKQQEKAEKLRTAEAQRVLDEVEREAFKRHQNAAKEAAKLEDELRAERKKIADIQAKEATDLQDQVAKLELQRAQNRIADIEKSIKQLISEIPKTNEQLVEEIITEHLERKESGKTEIQSLIDLVKEKLDVSDREATNIATQIANGIAENIKAKIEKKFGNQLSQEEAAAKKEGRKPKDKNEAINELIRASNLGANPNIIADYFKNKYGIQELTSQDIDTITKMAEQVGSAPTSNRMGVLLGEIQKLMDSKKDKTLRELLQSLWYAKVLSGVYLILGGTSGVNVTFNLLALKINSIEAPLTMFNSFVGAFIRDVKDSKDISGFKSLFKDTFNSYFKSVGQTLIYDEAKERGMPAFLSALKQSKYMQQSWSYLKTTLQDGSSFKKDYDNPFKATAGAPFDIGNWFNVFKKAENGDVEAQKTIGAMMGYVINGYVNGVSNILAGQDLFFGSIIGNLYTPALIREQYRNEGYRGEELNQKVFNDLFATKLEYENSKAKAVSYRLKYDITIEPKMGSNGELFYQVKDKGKFIKAFTTKEQAETYAKDVLAPSGNTFKNDIIYLMNDRLSKFVTEHADRIARNDLLSGDTEGGSAYILKMANGLSKIFESISEYLADYAKQLKEANAPLYVNRAFAKLVEATSIVWYSLSRIFAFLRVGVNSMRNLTNYSPLGFARYFASFYENGEGNTRALLGSMSYKMSNTERNKILSKAMLGSFMLYTSYIVNNVLKGALDDDEDDKAIEKFKQWYSDLNMNAEQQQKMDKLYYNLAVGEIVGSLDFLPPTEKQFYEKTGLVNAFSEFKGFDSNGKPIWSSIKNKPWNSMSLIFGTYKAIDYLGDKKDKENLPYYLEGLAAPLGQWKDMSIGQGGVSILFDRGSGMKKAEKLIQMTVLDNLEILVPNVARSLYGYLDPRSRKNPTLFQSLEDKGGKEGVKEWMFNRALPIYMGKNNLNYGMFGEELYKVPAEEQNMFAKEMGDYIRSDKNIEEQKMYIWLDINGYNKLWKPNKEMPMIVDVDANGDVKTRELTETQINKYGQIAGERTLAELKTKMEYLQDIAMFSGDTKEDSEKAFQRKVDAIFKKNFNRAYYEGEGTFSKKTLDKMETIDAEKFKSEKKAFEEKIEARDKSDISSRIDEKEKEYRAENPNVERILNDLNQEKLPLADKFTRIKRYLRTKTISEDKYKELRKILLAEKE
jgi:ribosomal protein S18 acetylase RimI-like enzyme